MLNKKNSIAAFISFLLLSATDSFGQKNLFSLKPDTKIFVSADGSGWVKFQQGISYNAATIFTDAKAAFALGSGYEMKLQKEKTDEYGYMHSKFRQTYNGIDIAGGQYIIHSKNLKLHSGNGHIVTPANIISAKNISEATALKKATASCNAKDLYWNNEKDATIKLKNTAATYFPTAQLVYLPSSDYLSMKLCYKFFIGTTEHGKSGYYYVNTQNGKLEKFATTEFNCNYASVVTAYYGARGIYTNDVGVFTNSYDLEDDCQGSIYRVYNNSLIASIYNTGDNNWNVNEELRSAATSLYSVKAAYYWFKNVFNRNGHGNNNEDIDIYNRVDFGGSTGGRNASFSYDPTPFSIDNINVGFGATGALNDDYNALDILAHEFTHGVTRYEADLDYELESGALNESFSDIFGEWVEKREFGANNWYIGWDIRAGDGCNNPLRSMIDPNARNLTIGSCTFNFTDPNTYGGDNWITTAGCTPIGPGEPGNNDHCGVHTNSGVQNQMFYLLSMGGTGWKNGRTCHAASGDGVQWAVGAIGIDNAVRIAYRVLCDYLTSTSNYYDARNAWVHAAADIFGECSYEAIQAGRAWDAVGIAPPVQTPPVFPLCNDYGNTTTTIRKNGQINIAGGCNVNILPTGNLVNVEAKNKIHIYAGFRSIQGSNFRAAISDECRFATY